jgi:hypothetical protein
MQVAADKPLTAVPDVEVPEESSVKSRVIKVGFLHIRCSISFIKAIVLAGT